MNHEALAIRVLYIKAKVTTVGDFSNVYGVMLFSVWLTDNICKWCWKVRPGSDDLSDGSLVCMESEAKRPYQLRESAAGHRAARYRT